MENGEMVAVCMDCFDNLRGQFIEAGKYGIPVAKRQYNLYELNMGAIKNHPGTPLLFHRLGMNCIFVFF